MEERTAAVKSRAARPAVVWRWVVCTAVAAALAAAAGIPAPATEQVQTSGDEPHYLLTADALGRSGSLDIAGAVAAQRYRAYHDAGLRLQAAPDGDGRLLAPHDPLLPAVLALPMRLGGWIAAKATLAALAGVLAGLLVWLAAARLGAPPGRAAALVAVFAAAPPLATYGSQVYPELPAALALTVGVGALTGRLRGAGLAGVGLAVIALPWLGVKYAPLAAVLALVALARLWRVGRRRPAGLLTGLLALAGLGYLAAHLAWYGGVTVYAAGAFFQQHGGELSVLGTEPDYLGRSVRLLGLLVDADFGLLVWQPAWLLAVPAVTWLARRGRAGALDRTSLGAPLVAGWLTAAFVAATMHGWWFPGRQVVVVLPLALLAVLAWALEHRGRWWAVLSLGATGVLAHAWLAVEGWRQTVRWVVSFSETANPLVAALGTILPDYRAVTALGSWRHGAWLAVVALLAIWGWRRGQAAAPPQPEAPAPGVGLRLVGATVRLPGR